MKILVTGGSGYFGSVLCPHLLALGHDVIVVDPLLPATPGVKWFRAPPHGTNDVVIHLAALVGEACQASPGAAHDMNCRLVEIIAVNDYAPRHIYISTSAVYGRTGDILNDEESIPDPACVYGKTKLEGERRILAKGTDGCVLRFGHLVGWSPNMRFHSFPNSVARDVACGNKVEVFAPNDWRPCVSVKDAARSVAFALDRKLHGIYNVVRENLTKRAIVEGAGVYAFDKVDGPARGQKVYCGPQAKLNEAGFRFNNIFIADEILGLIQGMEGNEWLYRKP